MIKNQDKEDIKKSDKAVEPEKDRVLPESESAENGSGPMAINDGTNTHLSRLISNNYIEYASYVIKEKIGRASCRERV